MKTCFVSVFIKLGAVAAVDVKLCESGYAGKVHLRIKKNIRFNSGITQWMLEKSDKMENEQKEMVFLRSFF